MAIQIYGGVRWSRTFRNIWLLEELGLPYENVAIHFASDETTDARVLGAESKRPRADARRRRHRGVGMLRDRRLRVEDKEAGDD